MFFRNWRFAIPLLYVWMLAVYWDDLSPLWIAVTLVLGLAMFAIQLACANLVVQLAMAYAHLLLLTVGYAKARWPA